MKDVFSLSAADADLRELAASVRAFLTAWAPEAELRRQIAAGGAWNPAIWARMAGELGLQGLALPERFGGSGYGPRELAVVVEETGRALLRVPFFETVVLAAGALLASGDESACAGYLPAIADGSLTATAAVTGRRALSALPSVTARFVGERWLLSGAESHVPYAAAVELVLVVADCAGESALFAVSSGADGQRRTPMLTVDRTRPLAQVELQETPARLIGRVGDGLDISKRTLALATTMLAAEQLAGTARLIELSTSYARLRLQFGRPIGSFQAVKHRCADMLVEMGMASAVVSDAVRTAAERPEHLWPAAHAAAALAGPTYTRVALDTIQIHGGIGFTWEHPAHLYLRRAKSSQHLLGNANYHRSRIAERLFAEAYESGGEPRRSHVAGVVGQRKACG